MMASKSGSEEARARLGRVRAAGIIAALVVAICNPGRFSETVFDIYQRTSPRQMSPMQVHVVEIDDESQRVFGQWPWSRYDMARITKAIGEGHPRAIGYDMVFPEPDRQAPKVFLQRYPQLPATARAAVQTLPSFDENFATELGSYPTVLGRAGQPRSAILFNERSYDDAAKLPVEAQFDGTLPDGVQRWPQAVASIPDIEETSAGHGLINGDRDADGRIRQLPAVGALNGAANTGFAVELARVALGLDKVRLISSDGVLSGVGLGGHVVPVAADGRFRPRFGHFLQHDTTPAAALFDRHFDPRIFAGKIVLLGFTNAGQSDLATTPVDRETDGVYVQAQAVDAILKGAFLVRPRWAQAAETIAGLVLALFAVLILPRLRRLATSLLIPLGTVAVLGAVSWTAFTTSGVLLDPLPPILIGGAAGFAVLIAMFSETSLAQRRLRRALEQQRVSAARTSGELDAASAIQIGMLPSRELLARLDTAIDLAAKLEPAREVGGDFYDAFRLGDGRVAFLIGDVTGKGVPAALFMALSKALARAVLTAFSFDLAAGFRELDAELSRDNSQDLFVTMLFGVIDPRSGRVELINAGHENPHVLRAGGGVEEFVMVGGPPLCTMTGFAYAIEAMTLAPGDGLVMTTDGVSEARTVDDEFFDRARLVDTLAALTTGWRAANATEAIKKAVRDFEAGAEPSDDLTVLALRRRAA